MSSPSVARNATSALPIAPAEVLVYTEDTNYKGLPLSGGGKGQGNLPAFFVVSAM